MGKAKIAKLRIYPIKSLGPVELETAEVGIHSLKGDRVFAMVDRDGRYLNGKRTNRVNQLQADYDLAGGLVRLSEKGSNEQRSFRLEAGNAALDDYLSNFFGIEQNLVQDSRGSFMDIPMESSLTVVSENSLQALQRDLERHSLENLRLRFRTNVELKGVPAYWEESLFQEPGIGMRFRIGDVEMIGISPRARCNVPPQDPMTGAMDTGFVRNMIAGRNRSLPPDSKLLDFGRSTYFLTVNVFLPESEAGKRLQLNDELKILDPVRLS